MNVFDTLLFSSYISISWSLIIGAMSGYAPIAAAKAELPATRTLSNGTTMSRRSSVDTYGEMVSAASSQILFSKQKVFSNVD